MTPDTEEALILRLGPGPPGARTLTLRVSPAYRKDLEGFLDEQAVHHSDILEFSQTTEPLWAYALSVSGGVGGIAAAISAFLHRHRFKEFKANVVEGTIDVKGVSVEDMERLLDNVLLANEELERRMQEQGERPENSDASNP